MSRMLTRLILRAAPLALLLGAGCSGQGLNSATGTLTYKGSPAKGALVVFHPKNATIDSQRPTAVTDENGAYTLTTGKKEGALAGEYVVTVFWPEETPAKAQGKIMSTDGNTGDLVDRLKRRYVDSSTSKLSRVVKPGTNSIPVIDLQ